MNKSVSNAGIEHAGDGTSTVPASRRPDGSLRAAIKIRPGYVPIEDKQKYRSPRTRGEITMDESAVSSPARPRTTIVKKQETLTRPLLPAETQSINAQSTGTRTQQNTSVTVEQIKLENDTKVDGKSSQKTLAEWSSEGWRGAKDTPSRFARRENHPAQATRRTDEQVRLRHDQAAKQNRAVKKDAKDHEGNVSDLERALEKVKLAPKS